MNQQFNIANDFTKVAFGLEMKGVRDRRHTYFAFVIVHEDTNSTMGRDMLIERNREKLRGAEKIMLDFKEGYETLKYLLDFRSDWPDRGQL